MPRRPASIETTLLILELLKRIPRRARITAPELRAQLEDAGWARSLRTVQRHVDLVCQHFDIERDERDRPYGYRWKASSTPFTVAALGEKESLLLTLAEQHLGPLLPTSLLRAMRPFFEQARSKLRSDEAGTAARSWASKVRVVRETQPLLAAKIDPEVFDAVSIALYQDRWLTIDYRNANGRSTTARVMPLGLAQQGARMYLVCRFDGFEDDRSLALHRMRRAVATTFTFKRPPEFDLKRYDDAGRFGVGLGRHIELSFNITKEAGAHLYETPLSSDQRIREYATHLRVSASLIDTAQLVWWLNGFGNQVTQIRRRAIPGSATAH